MCSDKDISLWILVDVWKNRSRVSERVWKSSREDGDSVRTGCPTPAREADEDSIQGAAQGRVARSSRNAGGSC